jgi:hypothetical protein
MVFVVQTSAHHGTGSYDTSKTASVKGTVTDFQFVNSHVLDFLDAKDDKGNVRFVPATRLGFILIDKDRGERDYALVRTLRA